MTPLFPLIPGNATQGYTGFFWYPAPQWEQDLISNATNQDWNVKVAIYNERNQW